jgi:hypothetical protein
VSKKIPSFLIVLFSFITIHSFGQIGWDSLTIQSKNRFFYGLTYGILPDIEKGPVNVFPNYVNDNIPNPPYPQQGYVTAFVFTTNFISIGGKMRYNLLQFTPEISLSVSTVPSVGAGFAVVDEPDLDKITSFANCSYNIPLLLEFNYGDGATHNSPSEYGLFSFAGVENTGLMLPHHPSNIDMMDVNGNFYTPELINHWTEAVFGLGIRYHNRRSIQREVFLKYGKGPSTLYLPPSGIFETAHPWTLKLSFVRSF